MSQHFTLTLRAASGRAGIRSLRALLKIAGRHLHLRAVDVRENTEPLWRSAERSQISSAARSSPMDMRKFSGSNTFIKVEDVRSGALHEKIAGVAVGKFGKPDITFESGVKLSVNATNTKALIRAFGADSESWIGHDVELYLGSIEYQGRDQEAVLLRALEAAFGSSAPSKKKPNKATKPDFDNSVEF